MYLFPTAAKCHRQAKDNRPDWDTLMEGLEVLFSVLILNFPVPVCPPVSLVLLVTFISHCVGLLYFILTTLTLIIYSLWRLVLQPAARAPVVSVCTCGGQPLWLAVTFTDQIDTVWGERPFKVQFIRSTSQGHVIDTLTAVVCTWCIQYARTKGTFKQITLHVTHWFSAQNQGEVLEGFVEDATYTRSKWVWRHSL